MSIRKLLATSAAAVISFAISAGATAAGPKIVAGPNPNPECFAPWSAETKFFQFAKKEPPYRIALANGFVGNTWRIQMIKTLKAYAEQPDVKPFIKELKVVSTGTDVAAQIAAIDNFINSGYDAILTIAVNPSAFDPVVKRANRAGVVFVPFDNVLDTDKVMMVNQPQLDMGRLMGEWLVKKVGTKGKILEVRGLQGNSVDRDRHLGFREVMEASGNDFEIIEVIGNWDDGTAQKVTADAIAVHGRFDGVYVQGGSTGTVRAMMDAGHPFVPVSGEGENGFRKLCAQHADEGLLCASAAQSPGMVAIAAKAAIHGLQGEPMPQYIALPVPYVEHPNLKDGENYWSNLTDNFFAANEFPPCNVNITAQEIMAKSEENN